MLRRIWRATARAMRDYKVESMLDRLAGVWKASFPVKFAFHPGGAMSKKTRQYVAELGGAMAAYTILVLVSTLAARSMELGEAARYAVLLSPMIGAAAAAWAIVRHVRRIDELQQRRVLEALAFSFAITAFGTFAWGFAEVAGAPKLPTFGIWPLMAALWIVGGFLAHRRYR
jgi:hypothetical protein